jgi:hypothetical protein
VWIGSRCRWFDGEWARWVSRGSFLDRPPCENQPKLGTESLCRGATNLVLYLSELSERDVLANDAWDHKQDWNR